MVTERAQSTQPSASRPLPACIASLGMRSEIFAALAQSFSSLGFSATEYRPQRLLTSQVIARITGMLCLGAFIFEPTNHADLNSLLFMIANKVATAATAINDYDTIAAQCADASGAAK